MKFDIEKYFYNSTIHGFCYFSKRFHIVERIFWIISLTCSAISTLFLITEFLIKLSNFPIVVYLSDKAVPLSEVNFPAVTFCPNFLPYLASKEEFDKYYYYRFERHSTKKIWYNSSAEYANEIIDEKRIGKSYTEILDRVENGEIKYQKLGLKILKRLQVIDIITNRGTFAELNFSIPTYDFLDIINEFHKEYFLREGAIKILWMEKNEQHISEILTPDGLCYTFNIAFVNDLLDVNLTSSDFHYQLFSIRFSKNSNGSAFPQALPRKISTSTTGFSVYYSYLKFTLQGIFMKHGYSNSFFIHDPFELPSQNSKIVLMDAHTESKILVDAELNTIDDSLLNYKPKERNCYLDSEKKLKFFRKYTKANCLQECLTDFMIKSCGCAEFFMIRNLTTRVCAASEEECYLRAKDDFVAFEQKNCDCLERCNYLKHNLEIKAVSLKENYDSEESVLDVRMNFKKNNINHFIRKQQYDVIDFLSYAGGLLGLFAGFSFLSFVELIYWFTIRVVIKNFRRSVRVIPYGENLRIQQKFVYLRNAAQLFLNNSSTHGLRYTMENNPIEKFFWIILITFSASFCLTMISSTREKVPESQIISFDDNLKFDRNITFPAITIIPELPLEDYFTNPSIQSIEEQTKNFQSFLVKHYAHSCICYDSCIKRNPFGNSIFYDSRLESKRLIQNRSQLDWLQEQYSIWNENLKPVFAKIRTQVGMGYTFNMIDADKLLNFNLINSEFGYDKSLTTKQPRSTVQSITNVFVKKGSKAHFRMRIKQSEPEMHEFFCLPLAFLIHEVDALPTFFKRHEIIKVRPGKVDVEVIPEIIRTERNLRYVNSKIRECYFDGEKSLKFFKKYTQQNCIIECITNYTLAVCNFTDPSQPFENDNFDQYSHLDTEAYCPLQAVMKFHSEKDSENSCGCKPTCDSTSYHVNYYYNHASNSDEIEINVWLNTEDATLFRRYQQFTTSDVVSYVGGLLGLLAGISMLSIVEFLYFFIIRVIVDIY